MPRSSACAESPTVVYRMLVLLIRTTDMPEENVAIKSTIWGKILRGASVQIHSFTTGIRVQVVEIVVSS